MRDFLPACLLLSACAALHAADIDYEAELQRAMKLYPPGDYNGRPVRSFHSRETALSIQRTTPKFDLSTPVAPATVDAKTLSSQAAAYFLNGRYDLAMKRFKQWRLVEPESAKLKACFADIVRLQELYDDPARRKDAARKYTEICDQLAKDILPGDAK